MMTIILFVIVVTASVAGVGYLCKWLATQEDDLW
jgi:hypothetical protein